jgi:hypothetical protein
MKCRWNRTMLNLWWPFWKWRPVEIFWCQESIWDIIIYPQWNGFEIGQCWICAVLWQPFWIFQCRDIIIYPHIKFWWYRTMLNFYRPYFYTVFWQPFRKFWKRRIAPLMVTYHYVKFYVSIIIHLEVININVRNFNFPIGFYSKPHPLYHKAENFRTN